MKSHLFRAGAAPVLAALLLLETAALAQPAVSPPMPAGASPDDKDVEARRADAKASFEKGNVLLKQEAWDAALAEFGRSRASYPTRAATKNAAICLSSLRRFDEALDMFEEVLKFSSVPEEERQLVDRTIAELQGRVGTLSIDGGEPGAVVVIDGRYRGTLPLRGPLRVAAGVHEVSAFKEGHDPFSATIEVVGKQSAVVKLRSTTTRGRLKVNERAGRALELVVDGTVMGTTPWEGPMAVGKHVILLRTHVEVLDDSVPSGKISPLAATEVGTQPVSVPVQLGELTALTLVAEDLDTSMRIEPTPASAAVEIDDAFVGWGVWEGRMRVGEHKVAVSSEGFPTQIRHVTLQARNQQLVAIDLARDRNTASFLAKRNAAVWATFGLGVLGLGVGSVTGMLAVARANDLKARCVDTACPRSEQANLDAVHTLGKISTAGFVIGGAGVLAGTLIALVARPPGGERRPGVVSRSEEPSSGPTWSMGVGLGQVHVEGSF
jgi:hypothetical protein